MLTASSFRLRSNTAATHDSQPVLEMNNETDNVVYADSAFWGKPVAEKLPENVVNMIHERGTKVRPLSEEQQANNRRKSKVRCRIVHIFGLHGITVRSIGIERAAFNIGLTNLIYNLYAVSALLASKIAPTIWRAILEQFLEVPNNLSREGEWKMLWECSFVNDVRP